MTRRAKLNGGRIGLGLKCRPTSTRAHRASLVAQIEFLEWTGENHPRHTKFIALRDDKPAGDVRRD